VWGGRIKTNHRCDIFDVAPVCDKGTVSDPEDEKIVLKPMHVMKVLLDYVLKGVEISTHLKYRTIAISVNISGFCDGV
jgi:hypothetical protein